ncbi:hypothetical protein FQV39_17220 [Bosea sp. F3-2]|uniref:hypothetical protein n=1 Tax=Bosea sp. F3-2 TaxID=2599640 RepID=UPI0011EFD0EE|nr:hypothetical protein [Bosea sp. F3-2]QEL24127.1 hypothetical protein FQV39_17220 [Bosea sp. F3-2]
MDSDPTPSTLDEIVLALTPSGDETPMPSVLELTVADLVSDSATEFVDLANVLGAGAQGQGFSAAGIEVVSMQSGEIIITQPANEAGSGDHVADASVLYGILQLAGGEAL